MNRTTNKAEAERQRERERTRKGRQTDKSKKNRTKLITKKINGHITDTHRREQRMLTARTHSVRTSSLKIINSH